ncbi:MAG: coenzyme F420-0:L-glutamate ligase [Mogibacterium sp.]|nr:coenzyme F420-0:L-glutamate ligase [Mogibacterium sp.]
MEFKANNNKNLTIETSSGAYDRAAIQTHFIQIGEDYVELVENYVKPLWQEGDILAIAEKIISLCQNNVIHKDKVKVSGLARFLSRFATQHNSAGIGVGDVYKMQYAIDINGGAKVFLAAVCAGFGKLVGKKGIFYDMVGDEVRGLDGFYPDVFPIYGEIGIPLPKNPVGICNEIRDKTGISTVIIDANDFTADILGTSDDIELSEAELLEIIKDNPAGQDDQCTPFLLIRKR